MDRILSIIKGEGLRCLPCERLNLDIDRFQEYRDSDEHPAQIPFESPPLPKNNKKIEEINNHIPTILYYFLDGSRRTYKIADVILEGRYLPLIAGQIGVAVVKRRDDGHSVDPYREFCRFENVITFPDRVSPEDLKKLEAEINNLKTTTKFSLLRYEVKSERDPVDLGVACIMSRMHEMEVDTVCKMAEQHLLGNDRLLVIDGSLRFRKKFDLVQFRNVRVFTFRYI